MTKAGQLKNIEAHQQVKNTYKKEGYIWSNCHIICSNYYCYGRISFF